MNLKIRCMTSKIFGLSGFLPREESWEKCDAAVNFVMHCAVVSVVQRDDDTVVATLRHWDHKVIITFRQPGEDEIFLNLMKSLLGEKMSQSLRSAFLDVLSSSFAAIFAATSPEKVALGNHVI